MQPIVAYKDLTRALEALDAWLHGTTYGVVEEMMDMLSNKIPYVKCDKCGSENVIRIPEQLPMPRTQSMTEYMKNSAHALTFEISSCFFEGNYLRHRKLHIKCEDCGYELVDWVM